MKSERLLLPVVCRLVYAHFAGRDQISCYWNPTIYYYYYYYYIFCELHNSYAIPTVFRRYIIFTIIGTDFKYNDWNYVPGCTIYRRLIACIQSIILLQQVIVILTSYCCSPVYGPYSYIIYYIYEHVYTLYFM